METVVLTEPIHEAGRARLLARDDIRIVDCHGLGANELKVALPQASAIIVRVAPLPAALLQLAPALKVIAKHGVGTDNIDVAHCSAHGIPVANTPGANAVAVAEHAMMMMLALAKDVTQHDAAVRAGKWSDRFFNTPFELAGRTLLIVGFGRSGRELALRARAFGMRVLAAGRTLDHAAAKALDVETVADWRTALPQADVVSLHLPRQSGATHLMGAGELAAMRPGGLIVNCARGGLIDEEALAAALRGGRLRGAGLDVFEHEPPDPSSPILGLANVILSPHSAGNTGEAARRMAEAAADNVLAAFDGRLDPSVIVNRGQLMPRP